MQTIVQSIYDPRAQTPVPEQNRAEERGRGGSKDPINDLLYGATGEGSMTLEPGER